jgi:PKD repeat protein
MGSIGHRRSASPPTWLRPRSVRGPIAAAVTLLVIGFLLPTLLPGPVSFSGASSPSTPPLAVGTAGPGSGADPAPVTVQCASELAGWAAVDAIDPAPNVASTLQSPCAIGHDVPSLYFVSNASNAGSKVRFSVALPPNGTSPASALSAFWVGLWVSGIPCSYGGASYLTVELLPPFVTQAGATGHPYWTVRAPVWDLVPAGSCDSQCQNDTAFFTISGRSFCEDDAAISGMGSLAGAGGQFYPGDLLTIDLAGSPGGPGGLMVYINDTTRPARDISWGYTGATVLGGSATVSPLYDAAAETDGGWTGGLNVGFGWQNCPLPVAGTSFATSCNSYDGPVVNISGAPNVDGVASWNSTTHSYSNRFPWVVTQSSSGACSGLATAAPCADFTTYGGTGAYPTFEVESRGGFAWYTYGASSPLERNDFGGGTTEFPADGSLSALHDPTTLSALSTSVGSSSVRFQVRATDPNGVAAVTVSSWWCTTNATRAPFSFPAALSLNPLNSSTDGNWTVNVPTGAAGMTGEFYYSVDARSDTGTTTAALTGRLDLTSGAGGSCTVHAPNAPGFAGGDIRPLGGGYAVTWNETSSSGVTNFTIDAHPTAGGSTLTFPEGNVTSARVTGLAGNATYDLSVIATNPAGLSTSSASVGAAQTLFPLIGRTTNVTTSSSWVNQTVIRVTSNATGGAPPFSFAFSFGDGTNATVFTTSDQASAFHYYGRNYSGDAVVSVQITDGDGDAGSAPTVFVPVRATPAAVAATIQGGDDFVALRWSPPALPPVNASAFAVTSYTVYWTTNASAAPYLTSAWPTNASFPSVQVANLNRTTVNLGLGVPDGTEVYAQVVAWDKYGEGLLPAETGPGTEPVLTAAAAAFAAGAIATTSGAGGPAPFAENFSTPFTTGVGTTLVSATYRFSGGGSVAATISGAHGEFWANASTTFDSPGLISVYLYALDSLSESAVVATTVLVTPGVAPLVSVVVAPTPVWANASVTLTATASGGSGQYNFSWDLGDGSNATGANVTYSYTAAATYVASVTVTDRIYGGVTVDTLPVTVLAVPTIAIIATANGGAGTYRLAADVTGGFGNLSYTWIFDDGTQGAGAVVSHTWTSAGTYTVTLEVTDQYGHTASTTTIIVVGAQTTVVQNPSTGTSSWLTYALLGAVVVLAVLCLLLVLRGRRGGPPSAAAEPMYGDPEGPGSDAPTTDADYQEESPRGR